MILLNETKFNTIKTFSATFWSFLQERRKKEVAAVRGLRTLEVMAEKLNGQPIFKDSIVDLIIGEQTQVEYEVSYDDALNNNLRELGMIDNAE